MSLIRKTLLALTAAATALGALAPAQAGPPRSHGGVHVSAGWSSGPAWRGHYKRPHYYYGSRHYRHRHHKRGLSGGEAALLAAGVIGGIILIDSAIERERRYAYQPRYAPPPPRGGGHYYRRDDRPRSGPDYRYDDYGYDDYDDDYAYADDGLDGALLGGEPRGEPYGAAPRGPALADSRYNYGAAYNDCKAETRAAAGDAGLMVALPARPTRIEPIDAGEAVRFTAGYVAQDRRGGEWRRTMVCEADEAGVRFLELI